MCGLSMQTESVIPAVSNGNVAVPVATVGDKLADFTTNRRVLLLSAMALVIGAVLSENSNVEIFKRPRGNNS